MSDALETRRVQRQQERWSAFTSAADVGNAAVDTHSAGGRAFLEAFASSEFVSAGCARHPGLAHDLIESGDLFRAYGRDDMARRAAVHLQPVLQAHPEVPADRLLPPLQTALRQFRRREMVRIAVRDLAAMADLDEVMADLSALAGAAIDAALEALHERLCAAVGAPRDADGHPQRLVVLGMGKLGAGELNFSSDVDLIFAFPGGGETAGGKASVTGEAFFTRLGRYLIRAIGENTADGFVFRTDMRLRPYGESGPLVMSFDHMEDYYQSQGREWERYALIKSAVIAGDREAGRRLRRRLQPFVYRRYLDFGVFESLREMKRKINAEVRRKGIHDNIKLGSGGIREIEFFGQMFQLIRGGVVPALQQPAIQAVLATLAHDGYIPQAVCDELTAAYRFLRRSEHRLQAAGDQQTHTLPTDPLARHALARAMGFDGWEAYRQCLDGHRARVRTHFDGLLESDGDTEDPGAGSRESAPFSDAWNSTAGSDDQQKILTGSGFADGAAAAALLEAFSAEPATRSLSGTGKRRLDRLMPRILESVSTCDEPVVVLDRMLQLLKRIQQRTSYLSLLIEYPNALAHLVRLVGASPWIADFLSRHPVLLDELLDPRTLYAPPDRASLRAGLDRQLAAVPDGDLEYQIEAMCIFRQVNVLRVAASDITSVLPLMKVSDHLTWIAEAILNVVVEISWNDLVARHGRPTCTLDGGPCERGFAVIGYGKLGGLELGYGSDLDLVFLHAADSGETVGGARPVDNSHFFARLGQRVVHMLTTHTAAGSLYETDMRLRPNGSSGLLVSHVNGFADYQMESAWTWEHQAIIRARPIAGDERVLDAFRRIRRRVLCRRRPPEPLKREVRDMRERMRTTRLSAEPDRFDVKEDVGAMVDIEFLVQYLVLRHAADHPDIIRWTDNVRLLQALAEAHIVDDASAYRLRQAYLIFRAAVHRLNLQERSTRVDKGRFEHLQRLVQRIWTRTLGDSESDSPSSAPPV